jgi:hypothetical protein
MISEAPPFLKFTLHVLEYGGESYDFSKYNNHLNFYYTRVESDRYIHPKSRNLSVYHSLQMNPLAEILMVCDCDLIFKKDFWINFLHISFNFNIWHGFSDLGFGSLIISKNNFLKLRGYNELMSNGWGWEDCDLYERAKKLSLYERVGWIKDTCYEINQNNFKRQIESKTNLSIEESNEMNKNVKEFYSIF